MISLEVVQRLCTIQDNCLECPIFDDESGNCMFTCGCKPYDWDPEKIEERIQPKIKPSVLDALRELQNYCNSIGSQCEERCPLWSTSTGCVIQDIPERWRLEKLEKNNDARRD